MFNPSYADDTLFYMSVFSSDLGPVNNLVGCVTDM